jgi:hypothetical protein
MKPLSTLLILLISTSITHAEEGIIKKPLEYDVEIIIFEDANASYINSEDWTRNATLAEPVTEPNKTTPGKINPPSYKDIKPEILKAEYKRINNSKEYNVLFYGSWRQTGLEEKKAFNINIEKLANAHKSSSKNTIKGNFKLVLARYLHIYSEMEYQRNLENTAVENTITNNGTAELTKEDTSYQMKIHRRMRSKELHYIDHPLVGMLIQINPVKVSTEETAEKSAAL